MLRPLQDSHPDLFNVFQPVVVDEPKVSKRAKCPRCNERRHLHRSRWRFQDLLRMLFSVPMRCGGCRKRFFVSRFTRTR